MAHTGFGDCKIQFPQRAVTDTSICAAGITEIAPIETGIAFLSRHQSWGIEGDLRSAVHSSASTAHAPPVPGSPTTGGNAVVIGRVPLDAVFTERPDEAARAECGPSAIGQLI